jgi:hypothetical protein
MAGELLLQGLTSGWTYAQVNREPLGIVSGSFDDSDSSHGCLGMCAMVSIRKFPRVTPSRNNPHGCKNANR